MNTYFYYKCLRKSIIEFLNVFNDIKIAKYDTEGNILKTVNVPIKLVPKQKFYSWIYNRTHEKRYPMIGAEIVSLDHANERLTGKHEKINLSESTENSGYQFTYSPAPYNIGFRLSIATEYINEMDQIIEQMLCFFNPYIYSTVKISELDFQWNMRILFNSASIDLQSDIAEESERKIIWTLDFTAETYFVQPVGDIAEIKKISTKFYTTADSWQYHGTETEEISGVGHQHLEQLIIGERDEDGATLIKYEVFE